MSHSKQVAVLDYRPYDDPQSENPCAVVLSAGELLQADLQLLEAAQTLGVDLQARRKWAQQEGGADTPYRSHCRLKAPRCSVVEASQT